MSKRDQTGIDSYRISAYFSPCWQHQHVWLGLTTLQVTIMGFYEGYPKIQWFGISRIAFHTIQTINNSGKIDLGKLCTTSDLPRGLTIPKFTSMIFPAVSTSPWKTSRIPIAIATMWGPRSIAFSWFIINSNNYGLWLMPPVINWFIKPSNYSYKYHKP